MELHVGAHEEVGHRCRHQGRDEQRQGRCCAEVEHKHLEDKHDTGERSLENAGNGTCGTTAQENAYTLGTQPKPTSDIGADGRSCGGYRGLKSHTAAKGHRERRGNQ